jgi:hypothetical protein
MNAHTRRGTSVLLCLPALALLASVLVVLDGAIFADATPSVIVPGTRHDPIPARPESMASLDAEAACCSGGANGGTDPTGNECSKLESAGAEFVDGRRVHLGG